MIIILFAIFVLFILIFITIHLCFRTPKKQLTIFAIMVTNESRNRFVPRSIQSFLEQTYLDRHLIILNHGKTRYLDNKSREMTEIMCERSDMTLGDLRNLALAFVPINAYWITWDDDDLRSKQYFDYLVREIGNNDALFLRNRMEINLKNDYIFRSWFRYGSPHFLCKNLGNVKYLSKNSLEDVDLYRDLLKSKKKIKIVNNDPMIYIRIIHGSNTSLYVDNNKNKIVDYSVGSNYRECEPDLDEVKNVLNIINGMR